ncbi:MAG: glycosyltransferase family 2 protein [Bacteroidota bacterium]
MLTFSIIIPAYNLETYIGRCLDSCLNQNFDKSNYEIIVVDDGSLDATGKIIKGYKLENHNIIYFSQENKGASAARNQGLKLAQGEYIWFVDGDDTIASDALNKISLKIKSERDFDLLFLNYKKIDSKSNILKVSKTLDIFRKQSNISGVDFFANRPGDFIMPVRYVIRRDFINTHKIYFCEGMTFEDNEWAPRLLYFAKTISNLDYCLYYYFKHSESMMASFNFKKIDSYLILLKNLKNFRDQNFMDKKFKHLLNQYIIQISSQFLHQRENYKVYGENDIKRFKELKAIEFVNTFNPIIQIKTLLIKFFPGFYSKNIFLIHNLKKSLSKIA